MGMGTPEYAAREVRRYYAETTWDYQWLWSGEHYHFGAHDPGTRSHTRALGNMVRTVAERAGIGPGSVVLDAGCGVGGTSCWLARERSASVLGLTLLQDQAQRARQLALRRQVQDRTSFIVADFVHSGLRENSFDAVIALESLCHCPEREAFYREAYRLLKPGGRLVVAETMIAPLPRQGARANAIVDEWRAAWSLFGLCTPEDHHASARGAGFADLRLDDMTSSVEASSLRLYRAAVLTYPFAMLAATLGLRTPVQHANVRGSLQQYRARRLELWVYGVLSASKPLERPLSHEDAVAGQTAT